MLGAAPVADAMAAKPPELYELVINGESFTVEANRVLKLESRQRPGTDYEVALRVAPIQRIKLGHCQFEYASLFDVSEQNADGQRSVTLNHELGLTMLITEIGGPLEPDSQAKALQILTQSVQDSLSEADRQRVSVSKPQSRRFGESVGLGVVIRYEDAQQVDHTWLAYVLVGKSFTVTCVTQYLDRDADDVLPLVRQTLESFCPTR